MDTKELRVLAYDLRKDMLNIIMSGGTGHIGGDSSVMEILTTLYFDEMNITTQNQDDPARDYFILSKGHSMEAYYAVLCRKGFLNLAEVTETFSKFGSPYIGHPNNKLPGIEMNSGSLGHGLPVSVGMALAAKMDHRDSRVYVVCGDGEMAEGSNWEAAMAAHQYNLDNLCLVIDRNRLQISGTTDEVMSTSDLCEKFASFGWHVIEVKDGNDVGQLQEAFKEARNTKDQPTVLVADTVKGKGSAVMENKAGWHHKVPTQQEYEQIMADFEKAKEALA